MTQECTKQDIYRDAEHQMCMIGLLKNELPAIISLF